MMNPVELILDNLHDVNKVAFSGTHGTGKTTSVFDMATRCKKRCNDRSIHILTELASESPFKINKQTTEESQLWIFTNQIKTELEMSMRYSIVITDRTIVDSIGYSKTAGFNHLVEQKIELTKSFIHTYDYIFFKQSDKNNYLFTDGIRDGIDTDFRLRVEDNMILIYDKLLPYMKNKDVLRFI